MSLKSHFRSCLHLSFCKHLFGPFVLSTRFSQDPTNVSSDILPIVYQGYLSFQGSRGILLFIPKNIVLSRRLNVGCIRLFFETREQNIQNFSMQTSNDLYHFHSYLESLCVQCVTYCILLCNMLVML